MELLAQTISFSELKITILDVVIFLILFFYIIEGIASGFILACLDLLSFTLSFILGLQFYSKIGLIFSAAFGLPSGFANAIGFFIAAFVGEILLRYVIRRVVTKKTFYLEKGEKISMSGAYLTTINHVLGAIPAFISATILLAFLLTLLLSFPLSPFVKKTISSSTLATIILTRSQGFEKTLNNVFGQAIEETLTFFTIKPGSNETVPLQFTTTKVTIDEKAEEYMVFLVNKERKANGLPIVTADLRLREVARSYAKDMFARGYFSHYTPEGLSPFDRMALANIDYGAAGENLALAPNTDLAMQGLLNSEGHRANILSPNFKKIGVGVIDGGIYGEMFVQEFTD